MHHLRSSIFLTLLACQPVVLPVANVQVPTEVQFVDIALGVRVQRPVALRNTGTAPARVRLVVAPPLGAVGSALELGPQSEIDLPMTASWPEYGEARVPFFVEVDGTLHSSEALIRVSTDFDADGADAVDAGGTDCNDTDASTFPGAPERCDLADNDCDGTVDEESIDGFEAWTDADQDGFGAGTPSVVCALEPSQVSTDGDCDDEAFAVNPDADEIYYDGVDQDCDGSSDFDADQDGFDSEAHGGLDCDDADGRVSPSAIETLDLRDEDCDAFVDEDFARRGSWAFSELMSVPTAVEGRFVELRNNSATALDCASLVLTVAGGVGVALPSLLVLPGDHFVMCESDDASRNGGLTVCDAVGPVGDAMVLTRRSLVLDEVDVAQWPRLDGVSLESLDGPDDNDVQASWCPATRPYGDGDLGTPGSGASCP